MRIIDADKLKERIANTADLGGWIGDAITQIKQLAIKYIDSAPSVDMPTWIPCSERLPEIGQKVLASTKKTVFTQVFKGYYSDPKRWAWENNRIKRIEAWQPLPMPWEGENDEKVRRYQ